MLRIRDIKLVQSQTAEAMAQLKALLRSQRSFGMQARPSPEPYSNAYPNA